MEYIESMDNYYKDDELLLFETVTTVGAAVINTICLSNRLSTHIPLNCYEKDFSLNNYLPICMCNDWVFS